MGARRKARSLALQALYGLELQPDEGDDLDRVQAFLEHFPPSDPVRDFFLDLVRGTLDHGEEIDAALRRCSDHWRLERMPVVDRNLLRLAAFELLHHDEIPPSATISEAVDLAKRFGSESSPAFVNGILDRVAREAGRLPAS